MIDCVIHSPFQGFENCFSKTDAACAGNFLGLRLCQERGKLVFPDAPAKAEEPEADNMLYSLLSYATDADVAKILSPQEILTFVRWKSKGEGKGYGGGKGGKGKGSGKERRKRILTGLKRIEMSQAVMILPPPHHAPLHANLVAKLPQTGMR